MEENNELINNPAVEYTDDNIRHLSDMEHVRTRPGTVSYTHLDVYKRQIIALLTIFLKKLLIMKSVVR